jgi:hypothetical protein
MPAAANNPTKIVNFKLATIFVASELFARG